VRGREARGRGDLRKAWSATVPRCFRNSCAGGSSRTRSRTRRRPRSFERIHPRGVSVEAAAALRRRAPAEYVKRSVASIAAHVEAMLALKRPWSRHLRLRKQHPHGGARRRSRRCFEIPGFVPEYIRPLFCEGKVRSGGSPFRVTQPISIAPTGWCSSFSLSTSICVAGSVSPRSGWRSRVIFGPMTTGALISPRSPVVEGAAETAHASPCPSRRCARKPWNATRSWARPIQRRRCSCQGKARAPTGRCDGDRLRHPKGRPPERPLPSQNRGRMYSERSRGSRKHRRLRRRAPPCGCCCRNRR